MIVLTEKQFIESHPRRAYAIKFVKENPRLFPLLASEDLANLLGSLIADGHLSKNMVMFYSKNEYEINNFLIKFQGIFGIKFKHKIVKMPGSRSALGLFIFSAMHMRILNLCGCHLGHKANFVYGVPKWIFTKDSLSSAFISSLFDGDGCVVFHRNRIKIKFKQQKAEKIADEGIIFLEDVRSSLFSKGIKSTNIFKSGLVIRKDGTTSTSLEFEIDGTRKNLSNIIKFRDKIGFKNIDKANKLDNYIEILKAPIF